MPEAVTGCYDFVRHRASDRRRKGTILHSRRAAIRAAPSINGWVWRPRWCIYQPW